MRADEREEGSKRARKQETLRDKPFRKLYNCVQTEHAESFIERQQYSTVQSTSQYGSGWCCIR